MLSLANLLEAKMKKHGVAILGFGVVGGGVADLLTKNCEEIKNYLGCEVEIRKILDLRDFPDSPLAHLVTHDFSDVLNDDGVDTVMEMMGGSHPAYEYTVAALKAGKNVITSNKEVVANFGDEFTSIAKEMGVSYRFGVETDEEALILQKAAHKAVFGEES